MRARLERKATTISRLIDRVARVGRTISSGQVRKPKGAFIPCGIRDEDVGGYRAVV